MNSTAQETLSRDWFSKPADTIVALLKRKGVSAADLSKQLGEGALRAILTGEKQIDRKTARVLANVFGTSAEFWLRRQKSFDRDLDRAARSIETDDADDWLKTAKMPGRSPSGRLTGERRVQEIKRRLAFYDTNKPSHWRKRYEALVAKAKLRTSQSLNSDDAALAMWLRQAEIEAELVETAPWNARALRSKLSDIKKLSLRRRPSAFLSDLKRLCASVGVAVVIMRTPSGCRASGASKFINPSKAMVALSFRFRSNDHFWFTLFHELGHLLLHGENVWVDFDLDDSDAQEREANEFASDLIVPPARVSELSRLPKQRDEIVRFAISLDVAPGIIVGQMQHRGMLDQREFSYLKRRWSWEEIENADEAA